MTEPEPPDYRGVLLARITISRYLDPNDEDLITVDREGLTRLEVLGLLAFAQQSVWNADQQDEDT